MLDIHDGELVPNLETRRAFARKIREWQADIVIGHRPYDYHPDHRYVGVLLNDTAVVVGAPFFVPDTPPTEGNPIYLNSADGFADPKPFAPDVVVDIDAVAEKKFQCVAAMPSQFADADSWQGRTLPNMPTDEAGRKAYIMETVKGWLASAPTSTAAAHCALWPGTRFEGEVRRGLPAQSVRAPGQAGGVGHAPAEVEQGDGREDRR